MLLLRPSPDRLVALVGLTNASLLLLLLFCGLPSPDPALPVAGPSSDPAFTEGSLLGPTRAGPALSVILLLGGNQMTGCVHYMLATRLLKAHKTGKIKSCCLVQNIGQSGVPGPTNLSCSFVYLEGSIKA